MSENNTDALRTWLIVLPIIFILFLAAVFLAFVNVEGLSTEERLDYGTKALTTTGTIFAGIAVFINAFYAAKRAEAMEKSALAANESAKAALQNAQAAEDKQITERFAKAIEQLGNEQIEIRLGAIYTLERIANDSPKDHWAIMEILTAIVRDNLPLMLQEEGKIRESSKLRTDIKAALTVIERRNRNNDLKNHQIDLSETNFNDANFNYANLEGVNFQKAHFLEATFIYADMPRVNLSDANLQDARLSRANLQQAEFIDTNLQQAELFDADLQQANFWRANLQSAYLDGAKLQGANFREADLQRAKFSDADFKEANLDRAILKITNLSKAKNLEQWQIDSAKGDRTTKLPDHLEYPKHWQ